MIISLLGLTATNVANNPKQNVKSHSYSINKNNTVDREISINQTTTSTTAINNAAPDATIGINNSTVTDSDKAAWQKVAICEEGGNWTYQGSLYSGGLGMLNDTWVAYGGLEFASNAGLATIDQQIIIAKRIQPNPPDQYGCSGSW